MPSMAVFLLDLSRSDAYPRSNATLSFTPVRGPHAAA